MVSHDESTCWANILIKSFCFDGRNCKCPEWSQSSQHLLASRTNRLLSRRRGQKVDCYPDEFTGGVLVVNAPSTRRPLRVCTLAVSHLARDYSTFFCSNTTRYLCYHSPLSGTCEVILCFLKILCDLNNSTKIKTKTLIWTFLVLHEFPAFLPLLAGKVVLKNTRKVAQAAARLERFGQMRPSVCQCLHPL